MSCGGRKIVDDSKAGREKNNRGKVIEGDKKKRKLLAQNFQKVGMLLL